MVAVAKLSLGVGQKKRPSSMVGQVVVIADKMFQACRVHGRLKVSGKRSPTAGVFSPDLPGSL